MAWSLPWSRKPGASPAAAVDAADDAWARHVTALAAQGVAEPGSALRRGRRRPATQADHDALYGVAPSFADLLPWVEYLPDTKCMLLEDGQSVAAFFELAPVGTEGREMAWLWQARDALENALQDSFDELDDNPWVVQLYAQDEADWDNYRRSLANYLQPRAQGSAFSDFYLRFFAHHLRAIAKPGGLFEDTTVTRLPWRGQVRRVRMVVYRRTSAASASRRGQSPEQALTTICDRLAGGLANAGVKARRLGAADIHAWLLRWFNPNPTLLGATAEDRERFYALTRYPEEREEGEIELASGTDFAQRLFFGQPRSDVPNGLWFFDGMPHLGDRDGSPAHATRDGPSDGRDAQRRRCHERAVRPDARGHGDVPDAGRHAPGRAGGAPQPPRQEGRRRDPGLGADPAGTCSRRAA
jgi:hypothetical protein